jgi:hypothetical protein
VGSRIKSGHHSGGRFAALQGKAASRQRNKKASGDGEHRLPPSKGVPIAAVQAFATEL